MYILCILGLKKEYNHGQSIIMLKYFSFQHIHSPYRHNISQGVHVNRKKLSFDQQESIKEADISLSLDLYLQFSICFQPK